MSSTTIDLTQVLKDAPAGEWIALSKDLKTVAGTGKTLEEALAAAKNRGEDQPIVLKAPPGNALIL